MNLKRKQSGYTLIELVFVITIVGIMMLLEIERKQIEMDQMRARQLGIELFKHSGAVEKYVAANSGKIDQLVEQGELGEKTGVDWLRAATCQVPGTATTEYASCDFLQANNGRTTFGGLTFTTDISVSAEGALGAITTLSELTVDGRHAGDLSGLAALVASGASSIGQNDPSFATSASKVHYCVSATSAPICAGRAGRIVIASANNSSTNQWLRVDHGNNMQNIIEFDAGVAGTESATGFSLRQIKNVARIFNSGTDYDGDGVIDTTEPLFLGSRGTPLHPTLASAGVIVDADQGIMGRLVAIGNIETYAGDIIAQGGGDEYDNPTGGNVHAVAGTNKAGDVAGGNITASGYYERDPSGAIVLDAYGRPIFLGGGDITADDDLSVGKDATIGTRNGGNLHVRGYDIGGTPYSGGGNAEIDNSLLVGHFQHGGSIHARSALSSFDRATLSPGDIRADSDLSVGGSATLDEDLTVQNDATVLGILKSDHYKHYARAIGIVDADDEDFFIDPSDTSRLKYLDVQEISSADSSPVIFRSSRLEFSGASAHGAATTGSTDLTGLVNVSELNINLDGMAIPLEALLPRVVAQETMSFSGDAAIRKPICAAGGSAKLVTSPTRTYSPHAAGPSSEGWRIIVADHPSDPAGYWRVTHSNASQGSYDAITYCTY